MLISWDEAVNNGAEITGYKIFIQQHDSTTFVAAPASCDATDPIIMAQMYCYVSLFTLIEAPYSLIKNEPIEVKVVATNSYGDSDFSPAGNGALT